MRALPEQFRVTVYLAEVEGLGYREIAQITGVPVGSVGSRLHRGRGRLRDLLTDRAATRAPAQVSRPRRPPKAHAGSRTRVLDVRPRQRPGSLKTSRTGLRFTFS